MIRVLGLGFRILGFGVYDFIVEGLRFWRLGFYGLGFRIYDFGFSI